MRNADQTPHPESLENPSLKSPRTLKDKRAGPWLRRVKDWLLRPPFADDIFISYSRADGVTYATGLANTLVEQGFSCCFDQWWTKPGDRIPKELRRALRRSALLVVVGTPGAAVSEHVTDEVKEFKQTGRSIVPIIFDGVRLRDGVYEDGIFTTDMPGSPPAPDPAKALWADEIFGAPPSFENAWARTSGIPSAETRDRIRMSCTFTRKDARLRNAARLLGVVLALLSVLVGAASYVAVVKGAEALAATSAAREARTQAVDERRKAEAAQGLATDAERLAGDAREEAVRQGRDAEAARKETEQQQRLAKDARRMADEAAAEAGRQQQLAEASRREAERQQRLAFENQREAEAQKREAEHRGRIVTSREFLGRAQLAAMYADDPIRAPAALAVQAYDALPGSFEPHRLLRQSLRQLPRHVACAQTDRHVREMAYSGDGRKLYAHNPEGAVYVIDAATGLEHGRLELPGEELAGSVMSQDGLWVAAVYWPGYPAPGGRRIEVWSVEAGARKASVELGGKVGHLRVMVSADGSHLAAVDGATAQVWKVGDARPVLSLRAGNGSAGNWIFGDLILSRDGRLVAANEYEAPDSLKGMLRVWDTSARREVSAARQAKGGWPVAFSADGSYLAYSAESLVILSLKTGAPVKGLENVRATSKMAFVDGPQDRLQHLFVADPDGNVDHYSFNEVTALSESQQVLQPRGDADLGVNAIPGGSSIGMLLTLSDEGAQLWARDPNAGEVKYTEAARFLGAKSVAGRWGEKGMVVATAIAEEYALADSIRLWDVDRGDARRPLSYPNHQDWPEISFSQDREHVAVHAGKEAWVLNTTNGLTSAPLKMEDSQLSYTALSADGKHLLTETSLSTHRVLTLKDIDAGRDIDVPLPKSHTLLSHSDDLQYAVLSEGDNGPAVVVKTRGAAAPYPLGDDVQSVEFNPDGRGVAVSRSRSRKIEIRSLGTDGGTIRSEKQWEVPCAPGCCGTKYSSQGRYLLTGLDCRFSPITLWSRAGEKIRTLENNFNVAGVAFSPDDRLLALAGWTETQNGFVRIYETATGELMREFDERGSVMLLAFTSDGAYLATAVDPEDADQGTVTDYEPDDRTVWLWDVKDVKTNQAAARIRYDSEVLAMSFDKNDKYLVTAHAGETLMTLWRTGDLADEVRWRLERGTEECVGAAAAPQP